MFFFVHSVFVSSDAPPSTKEGGKGSMGKAAAAQFRLWGQLAAKVSSGKEKSAWIESCFRTSPCEDNLKPQIT
jgi:hypothetical protein